MSRHHLRRVLESGRIGTRMRLRRTTATGAVLALMAFGAAWSAVTGTPAGATGTYVVTRTADDSDPGSLRWAIDEANSDPGSTITVAEGLVGTITLTSDLPQITADTTVVGPGSEVLAVSGAGAYTPIRVDGAVTVAVSGLTLTNPDPAVDAATALRVTGGASFVGDDLVIAGTRVDAEAGLVRCSASTFGLTDSAIVGNSKYGNLGLVYLSDCATRLEGLRIADNVVGPTAEVLFAQNGTLTVDRSIVSGNQGSLIDLGSTPGTVTASAIVENSGPNALVNFSGTASESTIADTTISGNVSDAGSILFLFDGASLTLVESSVAGNTAAGATIGSLPFGQVDHLDTVGAIVAGNTVPTTVGENLGFGGSSSWTSEASVLGPTTFAITTDLGGNQTGVTDPGLAPLADNGGPTPTRAPLPDSPAIDAGPATPPVFPGSEWDQRGEPYARVVGGAIDVGAFEVQPAGALTWAGATELPVGAATATLAARVDPAECRTGSLEFTVDGVPAGAADVDPVTGVGEITVPVPAGVTALVVDVRLVGSACSTEPLRVTVTITSDGLVPTFTG